MEAETYEDRDENRQENNFGEEDDCDEHESAENFHASLHCHGQRSPLDSHFK